MATPSVYSLVNLDTGEQTPLALPISQSEATSSARIRPSIVPVTFEEEGENVSTFLLTSHSHAGTLGVFLRTDGEPTAKLLEWPAHPRSIVLAWPWIYSLLRDDTVEIHDVRTMQRAAKLDVPSSSEPRFLQHVPANAALLGDAPKQNTGHAVPLDVHTPTPPTGPSAPTDPLLPVCVPAWASTHRFCPTEVLLGSKRSVSCLAALSPASQAWQAVQAKEWAMAAQILTSASAMAASDVTRASLWVGVAHIQAARFQHATPLLVQGKFPVWALLSKFPAYAALQWMQSSVPPGAQEAWARLPPSMDELIDAHVSANYTPEVEDGAEVLAVLRNQLTTRSVQMLHGVLNAAAASSDDTSVRTLRVALHVQDQPDVAYRALKDELASCDETLLAPTLQKHHRYYLHAELHRLQGRTEAALAMYCAIIDRSLLDPVDSAAVSDVAALLDSVSEPHARIKYGLWLAKHDVSRGLAVLIQADYSHHAQPEEVIATLRPLDVHAAAALLEHIVFTNPHQMASLHTELCTQLRRAVVAALEEGTYPAEATVGAYASEAATFPAFLARHKHAAPVHARIKLVLLLAYSAVLDSAKVLDDILPYPELVYEQAVVLGRLGRMDDVLARLALSCQDAISAYACCVHSGHVLDPATAQSLTVEALLAPYNALLTDAAPLASAPATAQTNLTKLLHLYLTQPNPYVAALTSVLYSGPVGVLLSRHAAMFAMADILPRLPPTWPMHVLQPYLVQALRTQTHQRRQDEVVKALALARNLGLMEAHWNATRYVPKLTQRYGRDLARHQPRAGPTPGAARGRKGQRRFNRERPSRCAPVGKGPVRAQYAGQGAPPARRPRPTEILPLIATCCGWFSCAWRGGERAPSLFLVAV